MELDMFSLESPKIIKQEKVGTKENYTMEVKAGATVKIVIFFSGNGEIIEVIDKDFKSTVLKL